MDSLIQTISQTLSTAPQETAYFTTLDLQYAYSQLNLHSDTARYCNFYLVSGDMTGIYRFKTRFYELTDMPAEFQKTIDCTLTGLTNTFCFLDDILIVNRGRIEQHLDPVRKCLIKLDQEGLRINLAKFHFAKDKIEWLGHSITQTGITQLSNKLMQSKNYHHPQISKNYDTLVDQFTIWENLSPIYRNCVFHLELFLRKIQNWCGKTIMKNNSSF